MRSNYVFNQNKKLSKLFLLMLTCSALVLGSCEWKDTQEIKSSYQVLPPFDTKEIGIKSLKSGEINANFSCKDAPTPMQDLFFESMYDEDSENASIVDPVAYETYKNKVKPIQKLESGLTKMANSYLTNNTQKAAIAKCISQWMQEWSKTNGLLGKSNRMGEFVRKWALASISLTYIQIRDEKTLSSNDRKLIEHWIKAISDRVKEDFSKNITKISRQNNHMYWAVWGVASAAMAIDDQEMFNWAMIKAKESINRIEKDGTLPLEIARGPKAYNYHHYAALPLFMLANAGEKNNIDLFSENDHALKRLARLLIENIDNQRYFEKITGEKQNLERTITNANLSWLEIYYNKYKDPEALQLLEKFRPMKQSRLGGNATLLYSKDES